MAKTAPTLDQWRHAYRLADEVYALAPWTWMWDTDHLAFRDPEDGSPRFISVMGREGSYFAIAVYRRVQDVFRIVELARDPGATPTEVLEVSQLQLSFEDKGFLDAKDRQVIRRLGLRFQGREAWPQFRSYLPGQYPWFLERDELRLMTVALEQVLAVAPRFKDDEPGLEALNRKGMEEQVFLMRSPVETEKGIEWQEDLVRVESPPAPEFEPDLNEFLLERVAGFATVRATLEVGLRAGPGAVQERQGQRPFFPWVMLVVDPNGGRVVGHDVLSPVPTMDAVYCGAAGVLLDILSEQQARPQEIRVRNERVAVLFRGLCRRLGIRLTVRPHLPQLEQALESMVRFWQGQG